MIKIMTFNIRYGTAPDGDNGWERRKRLVIDRIRAFDPDLLGLQECRDDVQAGDLQSALDDYVFAGVRRGGEGDAGLEMAPLLFKRQAFDLLAQGHFWLSKTPTIAGSLDWHSDFPRPVAWARLRQTHPPCRELVFLNTHFDHSSPHAKRESARLLRRWVEGLGNVPVILTGDFNTTKDKRPYRLLLQGQPPGARRLCDAHAHSRAGTLHGFGSLAQPLAIDWILVSAEFQILSSAIDTYHLDGLYPSDHYPALAVVELQG